MVISDHTADLRLSFQKLYEENGEFMGFLLLQQESWKKKIAAGVTKCKHAHFFYTISSGERVTNVWGESLGTSR